MGKTAEIAVYAGKKLEEFLVHQNPLVRTELKTPREHEKSVYTLFFFWGWII